MVVVFLLPALNCFLSDILFSQNFSRHIIGGVGIKKQKENDYIYPCDDGNGIETTANDVCCHLCLLKSEGL